MIDTQQVRGTGSTRRSSTSRSRTSTPSAARSPTTPAPGTSRSCATPASTWAEMPRVVAAQVPPLRRAHLARPDAVRAGLAGAGPAGRQARPRRAAPLPRPARPLGRVTWPPHRSHRAKQGLKWSVHALDRLAAAAAGVTVLIYHRVGGRTPLDVDLPTAHVRGPDGGARRERTCHASIDDALDALDAPGTRRRRPPIPVVVTFDDGTADFADLALPILERHGDPGDALRRDRVRRPRASLPRRRPAARLGRAARRRRRPASSPSARTPTRTRSSTGSRHRRSPTSSTGRRRSSASTSAARSATSRIPRRSRARRRPTPRCARGSARPRSPAPARIRTGATDPYRLARSPIQTSDGMRFFAAKVAGGMRFEDPCATPRTGGATAARWMSADRVPTSARGRAMSPTRRLVHVTTTDMSLELLLGPQLERLRRRRLRGRSGRRHRGPTSTRSRHGASATSPLRHATRSMAPAPRRRRAARAPAPLPRPPTRHRAHPQPEARRLRPLRGARRARARRSSTPCTVSTRCPTTRWAKRAVVYGLERLAAPLLGRRAGPEPRGRPDAAPARRPRAPSSRARQRRRPRPASGPTASTRAARRTAAPSGAPTTTSSWSASSAGSSGRRATGSCSPPRAALAGHRPRIRFVVVGGLDEAKADQLGPADLAARRRATPASRSSASATTSTSSTAPWTCTCSRRTARASRARRWRRPRPGCPSSPPTSAAAARWSTTAAPASSCPPRDAAALWPAHRAPERPTTAGPRRDGRGRGGQGRGPSSTTAGSSTPRSPPTTGSWTAAE